MHPGQHSKFILCALRYSVLCMLYNPFDRLHSSPWMQWLLKSIQMCCSAAATVCKTIEVALYPFLYCVKEKCGQWIDITVLIIYLCTNSDFITYAWKHSCLSIYKKGTWVKFAVFICELEHLHTVDTREFREITVFPFCLLLFVYFSAFWPCSWGSSLFSVGSCTHLWVNRTTDKMCKYSKIHYL